MNKEKFPFLVAVYLILIQDEKLLLLRRFNTGWRDGDYTTPAGHVDGKEDIQVAMSREALEEAGLKINPNDLKVVHIAHHASENERYEYIDFYLFVEKWRGEPKNMEPEKCDDLGFFPIEDLPKNTLPNVKSALELFKKGEFFSEFKYNSAK